jgi:hypothetical protein
MLPAEGFRFVERPPFAEVAGLMQRTWSRPCWCYDDGLLARHIQRPSGDPSLAIGQVHEATGALASFQAYMPFDVEYFGRPYRVVFASFLTVSREFQRQGLAGPQQGRLIEKAIDKGYDLYLTMCEEGAASNRSVEKIFSTFGIAVTKVRVIHYRASTRALIERVLPGEPSSRTRPYRRDDRERALALVRAAGRDTQLRKIVAAQDIDFLFLDAPHSLSFVYEVDGLVRALVNVLVLEVLEATATKTNLYFENVLFGDLDLHEQEEFLGDVLSLLGERHFAMAFIPNIGYAPMAAFQKYHFRVMPRAINVLAAPLRKNIANIKPVDAFYFDVY